MDRRAARHIVRARFLCVLALVPFLASCAGSASVRGLLIPRGAAERRIDEAVIYVQPASDQRLTSWDDDVSLTFERGSLDPPIAVATVGAWLQIWNADTVFHQPFSRSPAAVFEARTVRPNAGTAVRLRSPGLVQIYCQFHEQESAELLVLENGAWTHPDTTGAFRLPPLPRGRYVIHFWHPRLGEQTTPLDIERPGPMSVELHY